MLILDFWKEKIRFMVLLSHLAALTPRKKRNKNYVPVYLTLRQKQPKIMIFQIPRIPPSPFQTKNAPFLTIPQHEKFMEEYSD